MLILSRPSSRARFLLHLPGSRMKAQQALVRQLAAEKDVGGDVEVIGQREVLIDGLDAERLGVRAGSSIATALPSKRSRLHPRVTAPDRILIRVDLPAALSPTSACISPR